MLCLWCWKECGPVYHGFQRISRSRMYKMTKLWQQISWKTLIKLNPENNMMNGERGSKRRLYVPRTTKSLSLNKKEFRKLIFHYLARKKLLHLNVNKVNSRRNMFLRKIEKIALQAARTFDSLLSREAQRWTDRHYSFLLYHRVSSSGLLLSRSHPSWCIKFLFKFTSSLQKAKHRWWLGIEIVSFSFHQ